MMNGKELQTYLEVVIPNIERDLKNPDISGAELVELYSLYLDVLRMVAYYDFPTFNKYLEIDEDHSDKNRAFYGHRKDHLSELFEALNDMEIHDKYDMLLVSMPPRVGKTTTGIRFLSWIIGRHPLNTQLATSYSDNITTSFYIGVMEIVMMDRYKEVFPESSLINNNAKREEIWLKTMKRYPSITFVPIGGSMTGRAEAGNYVYCDDLVSGIEEALSISRLESLWQKYTVNVIQRKKEGCKEIHVATNWSVHDPISKLKRDNADNPRCKILDMSCYDENGESNFNFYGGFSTNYYNDVQSRMDPLSFSALYEQKPIEREGLLYPEDDLSYYFDLPEGRPDTIIAVADSKNLGKDFVCSPIAYVYNDLIYLDDVIFDSSLPQITKERVANKFVEHSVVRCDIELNNGGNYYAEGVRDLVMQKNGTTSFRIFFSSNNKNVKIITYSDFVKQHIVFRHKSTYKKNSDYAKFMHALTSWTQTGKNEHDDAPDAVAMLAQLFQDLTGMSVKIINRRELGI